MPQRGGPAVLRAGDERDVRLPADLHAALREWAEVADAVLQGGNPLQLDMLRRRGRQLAARAADVLERPVEFLDPVSGVVEWIGAGQNGGRSIGAGLTGAGSNRTGPNGVGLNGAGATGVATVPGTNGSAPSPGRGPVRSDEPAPRPPLAPEPAGPTPWGTGLAVAVFFAVLVAFADIVLASAFAGAFGLLWVPANVLVTAGTVPSLWLARAVPFWRWPTFGAAAGLVAAWVVMLFGLLAP